MSGSVGLTTLEISAPVNVEKLSKTETAVSSQGTDRYCSCSRCCFICFYAICFSVLKDTRYWNENTLDAIMEKSNQLHENILMLKEHCTLDDLPNSLAEDVARIEARFNVAYKTGKKSKNRYF